MKDLKLFNYENHQVRVVEKDGQPWWVAQDVCDALGMKQTAAHALTKLDDDEKLISLLATSGQNREMWTVNESGLWCLVMRSNKPTAKTFRKWVTSEVLPSIRKTGGYGSGELADRGPAAVICRTPCLDAFENAVLSIESVATRQEVWTRYKSLMRSCRVAVGTHEIERFNSGKN